MSICVWDIPYAYGKNTHTGQNIVTTDINTFGLPNLANLNWRPKTSANLVKCRFNIKG